MGVNGWKNPLQNLWVKNIYSQEYQKSVSLEKPAKLETIEQKLNPHLQSFLQLCDTNQMSAQQKLLLFIEYLNKLKQWAITERRSGRLQLKDRVFLIEIYNQIQNVSYEYIMREKPHSEAKSCYNKREI